MSKSDVVSVVIQVGNSDDKLCQKDWHRYVHEIRRSVLLFTEDLHFDGCSRGDSQYQNACIVAGIRVSCLDKLCAELSRVGGRYRQDSVAVITGEVTFIKGLG